jgi:hypothetical protein
MGTITHLAEEKTATKEGLRRSPAAAAHAAALPRERRPWSPHSPAGDFPAWRVPSRAPGEGRAGRGVRARRSRGGACGLPEAGWARAGSRG